jgi:hypothetical protein
MYLIIGGTAASALPHFGKKKYRHLIIRSFFFFHRLIEVTFFALTILRGKRTLRLSIAQSACNNPARPSGIFASMNASQARLRRNRAETEVFFVCSAFYPTAIHNFPAVTLLHSRKPPLLMSPADLDDKNQKKTRYFILVAVL